jgi:GNAT superfamily N-acetyltransferase
MLVIERIDETTFDAALKLLVAGLGEGSYTASGLGRVVDDPESYAIVGKDGEDLVAVAIAQPVTSLEYYTPFGEAAVAHLSGRNAGNLSALSVLESRRGQGIGQQMTRERLTWMKNSGHDLAVAIAWLSGARHQSRPMFERLGFMCLAEAKEFYLRDSLAHGLRCVYCGGPCRCAGALFVKELF